MIATVRFRPGLRREGQDMIASDAEIQQCLRVEWYVEIYEFLEQHSIPYERVDHPPVYTCEEARRLIPDLPGVSTKSLFVRDKKGKRHFLVVVPDHKSVDLRALEKYLGCSKLSMGSPDRLMEHLGIEPGSVSILATVNDGAGRVEVVIDAQIWSANSWQCHPLVNTATLIIDREQIERLLELTEHRPLVLDIPERE